MTHVLALVTAKGGSGKTTLARGLLGAADGRGLRTGFLDTDRTENTHRWARRAHEQGHWSADIEAYQATDPLEVDELVRDIVDAGDLDLLIVDTPGDASGIHEAMFGLGDLVLCPLNLTAEAVDTAVLTANSHYRIRQGLEPGERIALFRGVINAVERDPAWPYRRQLIRLESRDLVGDGEAPPVERFPLLGTRIRRRTAYPEIEELGLLDRVIAAKLARRERAGVGHLAEARDEMARLLDECLAIMDQAEETA